LQQNNYASAKADQQKQPSEKYPEKTLLSSNMSGDFFFVHPMDAEIRGDLASRGFDISRLSGRVSDRS
jgi:hypothetical protein